MGLDCYEYDLNFKGEKKENYEALYLNIRNIIFELIYDYDDILFNCTSNNQKIILICDDSHKISTLEEVKEVLNNRKIDIAYIDGDHTYSGVKRDFELYRSLIKPGGLMIFHDIIPHPNKNVEVPKFWQEIHKEYEFKEIVKNWDQNGSGIGILVME